MPSAIYAGDAAESAFTFPCVSSCLGYHDGSDANPACMLNILVCLTTTAVHVFRAGGVSESIQKHRKAKKKKKQTRKIITNKHGEYGNGSSVSATILMGGSGCLICSRLGCNRDAN